MSVTLTQISNTQVFGTWLNRTNQTLAVITANAVTTDNTAIGGFTSGNGTVNGILGANVIFARDGIRGGNVTASNTLFITSNAVFKWSNSISSSNLVILVSSQYGANLSVNVNFVTIKSVSNTDIIANGVSTTSSNGTTFTSVGNNLIVSNNLVLETIKNINATSSNVMFTATQNTSFTTNNFTVTATPGNTLITTNNITISTKDFTLSGDSGNTSLTTNNFTITATPGNTNLTTNNLLITTKDFTLSGDSGNTSLTTNNFTITATPGNTNLTTNNLLITTKDVTIVGGTGNTSYTTNNFTLSGSAGNTDITAKNFKLTTKDVTIVGGTGNTSFTTNNFTLSGSTGNTSLISKNFELTTNNILITGSTGNTDFYSNNQNTTVVLDTKLTSNNYYVYANSYFTGDFYNNGVKIDFSSLPARYTITTTGTTKQLIDSISAIDYRALDYVIAVKDTTGTGYQLSKLLILHDGTDTYITEYGVITTGTNLGVFTVDIVSDYIKLYLTPTCATSKVSIIRNQLVT